MYMYPPSPPPPQPTLGPPAGDIVGVFVGGKSPTDRPLSGIVTRSTEASVSVAFDDLPELLDISAHDGSLQVVKLANDVTYKRIKRLGRRERVWGRGEVKRGGDWEKTEKNSHLNYLCGRFSSLDVRANTYQVNTLTCSISSYISSCFCAQ